jgi:predicted outer membrane repeat protein
MDGRYAGVFVLLLFLAFGNAQGATITVDSTADTGPLIQCVSKTDPCTLRAAIAKANSSPGDDTIRFVTGAGNAGCDSAGNCTIRVATALPTVTDNLTINGPGAKKLIIQRSPDAGTPNFGILSINPGLTVAINAVSFSNGRSNGSGGAITNQGANLTIRDCEIGGNHSNYGGAIANFAGDGGENATLTMLNTLVLYNAGEAFLQFEQVEAGGVVNRATDGHATFTATNCVFLNNSGSGGGAIGNISYYGNGVAVLKIRECTFTGNSSGAGGAIHARGDASGLKASVDIRNSTFSSNVSSGIGGAIYNYGTQVVLFNSTISGNQASQGGGGFANANLTSKVSIQSCTFSANLSTDNSAGLNLRNTNGTVEVLNTIFDRTVNAANVFNDVSGGGNFISAGHNLIDDAAGGPPFATGPGGLFDGPSDLRNTDAALAALADNGGPTQTHAISGKSDAINHGDNRLAPKFDQRGFTRSGVSDTGAYEAGGQAPSTLANISTRLRVETGDNALIAGFIVTGTESKKIMVRGIGPSLPFAGKLENPTLELRDAANLITANDNWVNSPNKQAIIDSTIPPSSDLESAVVEVLRSESSSYTAVLRGVSDGTGIGVVEVYDLDGSVNSRLANISTRGLVGTGDNVLIAGTIVLGQPVQKVILRAIGPSLPVSGAMADPTLELRDSQGALIRANDNWKTDQEAEIIATTVPPTHDLESAIVTDLGANGASYTAIVRGAGDTTGIALVEIYRLE